jgi:hypothetical protein
MADRIRSAPTPVQPTAPAAQAQGNVRLARGDQGRDVATLAAAFRSAYP